MKFYLGCCAPKWLWDNYPDVPLFVSRRQIKKYVNYKPATSSWVLDSGGFTELSTYGEWTIGPIDYCHEVDRIMDEIGNMDWAAAQDYMCEPFILKKTGMTIEKHQELTIDNFLELKHLRPDVPFAPVIQGWETIDYMKHVNMYAKRGVFLNTLPIVGIGSVCRRQGTEEVEELVKTLTTDFGISLHGFGFKKRGVARCASHLVSSDSMAWSFHARRSPVRLEGHTHKNCANCLEWALIWRESVIALIDKEQGVTNGNI